MTEYIINNPKNSALSIVQDGQLVLSYNGDRFQSLCSVVKITVAIEFSRQVSQGELDDQQLIDIEEVDKYYLSGFDNAHTNFKEWIQKNNYLQDNKVKLYYINLGMIIFSSNANTEYLQTLLTFKKIEQTQDLLNLKQSRNVYLVSAMLAFYNFDNLSEEQYLEHVKNMKEDDFIQKHLFVHEELVKNSEQAQNWLVNGYKDLLRPQVISVSSNFLTYSSTDQYSLLMDKLNQGLVFNKEFFEHFYPIIGYVPMSNPNQAALYNHAGVKGGSSAIQDDPNCVLATAIFINRKKQFKFTNQSIALLFDQMDFQTYQYIIASYDMYIGMMNLNGEYAQEVISRIQSNK